MVKIRKKLNLLAIIIFITIFSEASYSLLDGTTAIGSDIINYYGYDGSNVKVAIGDSGIAQEDTNFDGIPDKFHPDLQDSRIIDQVDYTIPGGIDTIAEDTHMHGTHIAGIIGGTGTNNSRYKGIAPGVDYLIYRLATIEIPIIYAQFDPSVRRAAEQGANIYSLARSKEFSNGVYDSMSELVDRAVRGEFLDSNGNPNPITFVVSAGNENNLISDHGTAKNAITVGAVKDGNFFNITFEKPCLHNNFPQAEIACFSNYGPLDIDNDGNKRVKPDIVAPGLLIASTIPWYQLAADIWRLNDFYGISKGTSMAAPFVSGAIALLMQKYPSVKKQPEMVKSRVINTAVRVDDLQDPSDDHRYGRGMIDAYHLLYEDLSFKHLLWQRDFLNLATNSKSYNFNVPSDFKEVRVTLAWSDPIVWGTADNVNHDLDFIVEDANGATVAASIHPDETVEHKVIKTGTPGQWTVTITGAGLDQEKQYFGLSVGAVMINPSLSLDITSNTTLITPSSNSFKIITELKNDGYTVPGSYIALDLPYFYVIDSIFFYRRDGKKFKYTTSDIYKIDTGSNIKHYLFTGLLVKNHIRKVEWNIIAGRFVTEGEYDFIFNYGGRNIQPLSNKLTINFDECPDNDNDGYDDSSCGGNDCDDSNPNINPGATEKCNNIDDNCANGIDEGCDDDNDGFCDFSMTIVGTPSICSYGGNDCNDNDPSIKPSVDEICFNNIDDNCNGWIDENCGCQNGQTRQCGTDVGECKKGTQTCTNNEWGPCEGGIQPEPERCPPNGKDDNCDGKIDEINCDAAPVFCYDWNDKIEYSEDPDLWEYITEVSMGHLCMTYWHKGDIDNDGKEEKYLLLGQTFRTMFWCQANEYNNKVVDNIVDYNNNPYGCTQLEHRVSDTNDIYCGDNMEWSYEDQNFNTPQTEIYNSDMFCNVEGHTWGWPSYVIKNPKTNEPVVVVRCGLDKDCGTGKYCKKPNINDVTSYYCEDSCGNGICEPKENCPQDGSGPEVCDKIDNNCDGQINEGLTQTCGTGACYGTKICNIDGSWSDCSTKNQDAGTCAKCDSDGNIIYDETQDSDCSYTSCPSDGCGLGGCGMNIFADFPVSVPNQCSAIHTCTNNQCTPTCESDNDNDYYSVTCGDCNDTNQNINPGAIELCDRIDNNCNGQIDEDNICNIKYYINLKEGWNLISFPLNPINTSITSIFKNINFSSIFSYGSWYYYFNETHNNFNKINSTMGFWINSLENQTLTIEGTQFTYPINFSLKQGHNLISYPSLNRNLINESLGNINFTSIYTYKNKKWYSYYKNRDNSLNTLKNLTPGHAYWINIPKDLNMKFNGTHFN